MKRIFFESHDMKNGIHIHHHTVLRKKPADYLVGFNWHKNIEFICAVDGEGYILCDGNKQKIAKGDIFIINSHELHGMTTEDKLEYDCLIVSSDFLAAHDIHISKIRFSPLIQSTDLLRLFMDVVKEITTKSDYHELGIRTKILTMFLYLMRHHQADAPGLKQEKSSLDSIKRGLVFIHEEYARKLSLDEIADASGLSKYHFSREFKKATGTTVTSYLNMVRCQHANLLIASNEYSVHDAAIMCGFTNDSLFSKTFRGCFGYLPSKVKSRENG